MNDFIILVDSQSDWKPEFPQYPVVKANDYIIAEEWRKKRRLNLINLCRCKKHDRGFYAALLADARSHRMLPSVTTLHDLSRKNLYMIALDSLTDKINKAKKTINISASNELTTVFYFGWHDDPYLRSIGRQIYEQYQAPILEVHFKKSDQWRISSITQRHISALNAEQLQSFFAILERHVHQRWRKPAVQRTLPYDLAILHDPNEQLPPSDKGALNHFIRSARKFGINAELITANEFGSLLEYDALFIRETTAINHHTYRFAKKAEREGLVVIDDPTSILRCVNKIYLNELLTAHHITTPKSIICTQRDIEAAAEQLGYPFIVKIPDGSFSRGMAKINEPASLIDKTQELFKQSELLLAQAFTPTDFDWRIGVLNRAPIYACKYFMSKGHWQIYNHKANGKTASGLASTHPIDEVPAKVIKTATKAASLIGDGLYGVDLKLVGDKVIVIEVNDNPSIDTGVEDKVLGNALYDTIMREFQRRLHEAHSQ